MVSDLDKESSFCLLQPVLSLPCEEQSTLHSSLAVIMIQGVLLCHRALAAWVPSQDQGLTPCVFVHQECKSQDSVGSNQNAAKQRAKLPLPTSILTPPHRVRHNLILAERNPH